MNRQLDAATGVASMVGTSGLIVSNSLRLDAVLLLLLASFWFAWHIERSAES